MEKLADSWGFAGLMTLFAARIYGIGKPIAFLHKWLPFLDDNFRERIYGAYWPKAKLREPCGRCNRRAQTNEVSNT
jgi:hypothetical protein